MIQLLKPTPFSNTHTHGWYATQRLRKFSITWNFTVNSIWGWRIGPTWISKPEVPGFSPGFSFSLGWLHVALDFYGPTVDSIR